MASRVQQDMSWLMHELIDNPEYLPKRHSPSLLWEYVLRHRGGQQVEMWETNGGADGDIYGCTVLWVPEEQVIWVVNCGLAPTWYFTPFTRDMTLASVEAFDFRLFDELSLYMPRSTVCETCDEPLTPDDWGMNVAAADGAPLSVTCERCLMAR